MYLKTRYALSLKFVPAQVRGNNLWSTSQVQLKILNYRTLLWIVRPILNLTKVYVCVVTNLLAVLKAMAETFNVNCIVWCIVFELQTLKVCCGLSIYEEIERSVKMLDDDVCITTMDFSVNDPTAYIICSISSIPIYIL